MEHLKKMRTSKKKTRFFEKVENYENYVFGKKKKTAFRYADRKNKKKSGKFPETEPPEPEPDRRKPKPNRTEPNRGFLAPCTIP